MCQNRAMDSPSASASLLELWLVFQISDSSFGGSLCHSLGLESALSHGLIQRRSDSLNKYIKGVIGQVM